MWKKLRTFARQKRKDQLLLIEALFELARARALKTLPFPAVAKTLGVRREESPGEHRIGEENTLYRISRAVRWMARHTPWESKCMETAIAARRMLERRGIACTLYFGTGRDETGRLAAHAWLRSGPFVITGGEEMHKFTAVEWFATRPDGRTRRRMRRPETTRGG